MVNSSSESLPLRGGTAPFGDEAVGGHQNSFELLFNSDAYKYEMPSQLGGRSVSHEEGLVAIALAGWAGKRPPTPTPAPNHSGGVRVDSGAWPHLLSVGGENVPDLALGGRKHPDGGAKDASSGGSTNDQKEQRRQQEEMERQRCLDGEQLGDMPTWRPFEGPASSRSSSGSNSRSSSRKARFLSRNDSDNLNYLLNYKSSSGSGSSAGGGPPREEGGRGATENAGGGRSRGSTSGGGASWERASCRAGGATTTHDGVVASNSSSNSSSSSSSSSSNANSKLDFGQHLQHQHQHQQQEQQQQHQHPLRQQSFQPDREIADLPFAKDICPAQPTTAGPLAGAPASRGVPAWKKTATTITTTITTSRSAASSINTNSSGVFVTRRGDHANVSVATTSAACAPSNNPPRNHINTAGGPIAPAPAPRIRPPTTAPLRAPVPVPVPAPAPAQVQHESKPSFNLLASMIPDISNLGRRPTAAALAIPGGAPGGAAGFPAAARGFAPAAATAAHLSPADSYLRVGLEDGGMWTRQAALARYRRKKKRRHLVKIMRENDPTLQEQNEARKRPRIGGKFTKETPDFVSIGKVQKAAKSRSISGELPARERESTTPPPEPSTRRGGVAASAGRSAGRAKSQAAAAGTRPSTRGGGDGAPRGSN
eukprot:g15276.t1